jgi:hypothetical protein
MGVPPSIPNWEQLKDQGIDYLASELSQQMASATGLPKEITDLAADKTIELSKGMAQKTMDAMTENRGKAFNGWGANWIVPFDGMEPAVRTIELVKKYPEGPPYDQFPLPLNLYLKTWESGTFTDLWVNNIYPYQFTGNLYAPEDVHVPEFPSSGVIINGFGSSLNIPIVLQPDYSTIPAPQCLDSRPLYDVKCGALRYFQPYSPFLPDSPSCWKLNYSHTGYYQVDCKNYNTDIAIYYRDYWIKNRLDDLEYFGCPRLSAVAYTYNWIEDLVGLDPWHLFEPPFGSHAFTPSEEANSWPGAFYSNPKCSK